MKLLRNIAVLMLLSFSQNSIAQLNETIWNFRPHFNKTVSVGDLLVVRDGTWARGIEFNSKGKFKRAKFVRWYKKEQFRTKPDNIKGKWKFETINERKFLYMSFSRSRKVKFEILHIDFNSMRLKVLEVN